VNNLSVNEIVASENQDISPSPFTDRRKGKSAFVSQGVFQEVTENISSEFPQPFIQEGLARAATRAYGVNWQPRVVRQRSRITTPSLAMIDYAVPCFELAKILGLHPNEIAVELCDAVKGSLAMDGFTSVAMGGYINFQVPHTFLALALQRTIQWLVSPRPLVDQYVDYFLVVGPILGQEAEFKVTDVTCQYIDAVYSALGNNYHIQYMVGDSSEEAVSNLAHTLHANHATDLSSLQLRRQLQAHLLDPSQPETGSVIAEVLALRRAEWQMEREKTVQDLGIKRHRSVFESDMAAAVHDYLDKISSERSALIGDATSRAVYYMRGTTVLALRSAEGFLYRFAYLFYALDTMRLEADARLTVLAPAILSAVLKDFLSTREETGQQVVFIDPAVMQADILEMQSAITSPSNHFLALAKAIEQVQPHLFSEPVSRRALLSIIDMPYSLSLMASQLQIPAIFDCIGLSVQVQAMLQQTS